jgi:alanine-glyoxylate transaminase/serine-glyoxylate transaminase/serine-pyruvate transaminase
VIPERVLGAMGRSMPNIYGSELLELSDSVFADLQALVGTEANLYITISNGHGAWSMSVANTMSPGDKVLVLESGRFALGWGESAVPLGVEMETLYAPERAAIDPAAVESRLRDDVNHEIKAVLAVQIDTASSVMNDVHAIRKAIDAAGHPALFMVDCIASLGCVPYEMDNWGVDLTIGASQKGLMVPPGVAFVWAGPKALAAHENAGLRTPHLDWATRVLDAPHYVRFDGTPPVSHLFALRESLDMLAEEGLATTYHRHQILGGAVRAAVDAWATTDGLECNIINPLHRSNAVTTIRTNSIDAIRLGNICREQAGLTLGLGIGEYAGSAFRIGHMGHLNPPMILGTIATVEAALVAMGAPIGSSGAAAAAAHVGSALS